MSQDKERYVVEALQKGVIAAIAASTTPSLPVRMLGRVLNPPSDGKWLEIIHIPNNVNRTWGDEQLYEGILRLVLHWSVDDRGVYTPMDVMRSINEHFIKGRKLSDTGSNITINVIQQPMYMGLIEEAPEMLFPYSLRYRGYVT